MKCPIEDGSGGSQTYTTIVKTISVKGISCAQAYEFLRFSYNQEK